MKGGWYSCQFNLPDITLYISIVYNKQKKAEKKKLEFQVIYFGQAVLSSPVQWSLPVFLS